MRVVEISANMIVVSRKNPSSIYRNAMQVSSIKVE